MKTIDIKQELNFINSEKKNISRKGDLTLQLLYIAEVLIINYINNFYLI